MRFNLRTIYNLESKDSIFREKYFDRFRTLPFYRRLQIWQRWLGAPYLQVEKLVPQKGKILDLGCGLGNFSHVLALTGKDREVVGLDFDQERIAQAKKTVGDSENLTFHCGNLQTYALEKCRAVVLFDVLHHLDFSNQPRLLKRIYAALENGGAAIIMETTDRPFWKYLVWRLQEAIAIGLNITKGSPLAFRRPRELTKTLREIGFKVTLVHLDRGRLFPHLLFRAEKLAGGVKGNCGSKKQDKEWNKKWDKEWYEKQHG